MIRRTLLALAFLLVGTLPGTRADQSEWHKASKRGGAPYTVPTTGLIMHQIKNPGVYTLRQFDHIGYDPSWKDAQGWTNLKGYRLAVESNYTAIEWQVRGQAPSPPQEVDPKFPPHSRGFLVHKQLDYHLEKNGIVHHTDPNSPPTPSYELGQTGDIIAKEVEFIPISAGTVEIDCVGYGGGPPKRVTWYLEIIEPRFFRNDSQAFTSGVTLKFPEIKNDTGSGVGPNPLVTARFPGTYISLGNDIPAGSIRCSFQVVAYPAPINLSDPATHNPIKLRFLLTSQYDSWLQFSGPGIDASRNNVYEVEVSAPSPLPKTIDIPIPKIEATKYSTTKNASRLEVQVEPFFSFGTEDGAYQQAPVTAGTYDRNNLMGKDDSTDEGCFGDASEISLGPHPSLFDREDFDFSYRPEPVTDTVGAWHASGEDKEAPRSWCLGITVAKVTDIDVFDSATVLLEDGTSAPANLNSCAIHKQASGNVVLKAATDPTFTAQEEAQLPPWFIDWQDADLTSNPLKVSVPRQQFLKRVVKANPGEYERIMHVYVIGATPSGYSPGNGQLGSHFQNNSKGYSSTGMVAVTPGYAEGRCEIQFTIEPSPQLLDDATANLFKKENIVWDVTRDKRCLEYYRNGSGWHQYSAMGTPVNEWVLDDKKFSDEDNYPWDGNGFIYGNDRPSRTVDDGSWTAMVTKLNMREYVNVAIRAASKVKCSDYQFWHLFLSVNYAPPWQSDLTYGHEIPTGNVFWGTNPQGTIEITTATFLPHGVAGQPYSCQLASAGGTAPVTWSVEDVGSLPVTIGVSSAGLVNGTPQVAGTYQFSVEVEDSSDPKLADLETFTLVIDSP